MRIQMKETSARELLYLKSKLGRRYVQKEYAFAGDGRDFADARNDWTQRHLCEADFDGLLHPTEEMKQLISLMGEVRSMMFLDTDYGKICLMNTPLYGVRLTCENHQAMFEKLMFREVSASVCKLFQAGKLKRIEIRTLDKEEACVLHGGEGVSMEDAQKVGSYLHTFFTREWLNLDELREK